MKDEGVAVAGKLVGRWRFKCPQCGTEHVQESTIRRCSVEFASQVVGGNLNLVLPPGLHGNAYEAAKKGQIERWKEIAERLGQVEGSSDARFEVPVDEFCRVENGGEAAKLVLERLKGYVDRRTREVMEGIELASNFQRELQGLPAVKLGRRAFTKNVVRNRGDEGVQLFVDEVEIPAEDVKRYYAENPNTVGRDNLRGFYGTLHYVDPDNDHVLFGSWDQTWWAVHPVKGRIVVEGFTSTSQAKAIEKLKAEA